MTEKFIKLTNIIKDAIPMGKCESSVITLNKIEFMMFRRSKDDSSDENKKIIDYMIYCCNSKDRFKFQRHGLKDFREVSEENTCDLDFITGLLKI